MSFTEGAKVAKVTEFNGPKPLIDILDVSPGDAQVSLNARYAPGKVQCREGFTSAFASSSADLVSSPYYWASGASAAAVTQYVAWLNLDNALAGSFRVKNLSTLTEYTLKTGLPASSVLGYFASFGKRLYASATRLTFPLGGAYVWDGDTTHTMDACFQRPMKTTEVTLALTQPGVGVCTAGTHYVGVLFQTRSGYWTRPGPCDASLVLQPQSIVSTGTNNIRATLTPASTWPTWIAAVQLIYTTTLNNFQYYLVPGTITSITAGSGTVYTIDFSVSDLQIRSIGSQGAGTLADDYFSLLSMDASNVAPFNVKFQIAWGNRIAWFCNYGGVDSFFVSDQLNPEWITADQHLLQLPNGLPIGAAFVLRGILYVISSGGGMFAYTDNGGRPINFSPPQTIDAHISVLRPELVTVASSGGRAFIAAEQGIYIYSGGALSDLPFSYYQSPDLGSSFYKTCIKDLAQDQTVILQGSAGITATYYVWNYQAGITPAKVRPSKWTSYGFQASYPAIEIFYNPTTTQWELLTSYINGKFWRLKSSRSADVALYSDYAIGANDALGIDFQYQTSPLPPDATGDMFNNLAGRFRAKSLQATFTVFSATKANPAVLTIANPHGLAVGTALTVTISGATGTGWTAINGTWTPTVIDTVLFSIPVNSTGFGTLGGTVTVTINGQLTVAVKSLDDVISVTPATSPQTISAAPGQRYLMPYDLQAENVSYLMTNGAQAGNGVMISELEHYYNLFATER